MITPKGRLPWFSMLRYSGRNIAAFRAAQTRDDLPNSKGYCTWNSKTMTEWRNDHTVNSLMSGLIEVLNEEVQ